MIINHNIAALNTHRQLGANNAQASKNLEKLSSGLQINRAGDDAAGLAISEKMRGQIRGLDMAAKNSQDGISLIQTAEGALNETHDILQRMRELATQAANDTNTSTDRGEIQKEINSLTSEINRIGNTTEFNTQKLLNGEKDTTVTANAGVTNVGVGAVTGTAITVDGVNLTGLTLTGSGAEKATAIKTAISGNGELSAKYDVTTTGSGADAQVVLTQKTGQESSTVATVNATGLGTVTTTAGNSAGEGLQFQIGANENQSLTLEIADMRASALGITGTAGDAGFTAADSVTNGTDAANTEAALDVSTHANAAAAVTKIQEAIDKVSAERSKLGANQNRLEHTINNLGTSSENLTAAESRIRDVDYVLSAA
ncbi:MULTISPECIES: flagellin [unclassified Sporosarcina]|uniref:flagellin N-terminal helical domain-containing protein n=1 Tax=unclassified Sporosarcina TaxID=2647733 RepID=UPI00203E8008|nr:MULTISPECIES: flagellin [unclassified Sporosarcina]GKV64863.1 flagellin [Sporosarcina sp. NCCP-2331]GLB54973.1 flagellin [Sporosarcina sp. NCCP-2378]